MIDDNVRKLIREVLAEELKRVKTESGAGPAVQEEAVSIASDADLAAFVTKLMKLAGDAKARRDIEQGRLVFRLAGNGPGTSAPAAGPAPAGDTVRMDRGVVSERQVDALPRGTRILQAGRQVKLTPLAKDRLRQRGIKIERTG
jgi:hypothetical protein